MKIDENFNNSSDYGARRAAEQDYPFYDVQHSITPFRLSEEG